MYLNPQIHDTQDTLTIRVGYIGIHSRIRISSPTCGRGWALGRLLGLVATCLTCLTCLTCHQPHADEVQRALSAQVDSNECVEEEGGAHGERSKGTVASPSARVPSGARLEWRRGGAPSAPWAAGQIERAQDTYPERIRIASWTYLVCIQRGSDKASKIHVSWCISNVSWSVVMTDQRYMYRDFVSCYVSWCILTKSPARYMYLDVSWCILLCIQCDT